MRKLRAFAVYATLAFVVVQATHLCLHHFSGTECAPEDCAPPSAQTAVQAASHAHHPHECEFRATLEPVAKASVAKSTLSVSPTPAAGSTSNAAFVSFSGLRLMRDGSPPPGLLAKRTVQRLC